MQTAQMIHRASTILLGVLVCATMTAIPGLAYPDYSLGDIDSESFASYTRLSLEVAPDTGYVVRELYNPPRLVLNLYPANLPTSPSEIAVRDSFVGRVRLEQDSPNVVKMTVYLTRTDFQYNVFSLDDEDQLVVDVTAYRRDAVAALLDEPFGGTGSDRDPMIGRIERIVLDPGHGGKDPGAIGPSGLQEKTVTLAVAKDVAQLLRSELGVEVYLTRETDVYLPLNVRTELSNQLRGHLFVSIHANAAYDRAARGIETFYNSQYVYDEGAEAVMQRENVGDDSLRAEARTILWDLVQNQYRSESGELAHVLQQELFKTAGLENRGVKRARFFVLRGCRMPAALVEIGFLSNPWEERRLGNKAFQHQIAEGIAAGLATYIRAFNTRVAR